MRQRHAQDLERLLADKAAIEDNRNFVRRPGLEHFFNQRLIERPADDPLACQEAPDAGETADRLSATGNVVGDFAQLDRLALDQADDNPHPDREPFEMQCRMECLELGGDAVV